MLKRWGEYLSSPQFVLAMFASLFTCGTVYDSFTSAKADIAHHDDRITRLEHDRERLARVEQKVDDIGLFLGVPRRP